MLRVSRCERPGRREGTFVRGNSINMRHQERPRIAPITIDRATHDAEQLGNAVQWQSGKIMQLDNTCCPRVRLLKRGKCFVHLQRMLRSDRDTVDCRVS